MSSTGPFHRTRPRRTLASWSGVACLLAVAVGGAHAVQPTQPTPAEQLRAALADGRWSEAEEMLRVAVERGGGPQLSFLLALSLSRQAKYLDALPHFESAEEEGPAPVRWLREHVQALIALQQCRAALPLLDQLVGREDDPVDRLNRALCQLEDNRLDAARSDLERVLQSSPSHQRAIELLAQLHADLGDREEACGYYGDGYRMAPDSARLAVGWSGCLEQQGEPAEALDVLRQAAVQRPRSALVLRALGNALLEGGEVEEGRRVLRQFAEASRSLEELENLRAFVRHNPDDAARGVRLVRLLVEHGEVDEAIVEARRLLQLEAALPVADLTWLRELVADHREIAPGAAR